MATSTRPSHPEMTPYGAPYRRPVGMKRVAMAKAREALRTFGQATAGLRAKPDYLVIGTKRGGTTSMARWLLEHPDVASLFPARETRKGTYYFDVNFERGDGWYRSHFPTQSSLDRRTAKTGRKQIVGEATPYYLYHPHAPARAREFVPNTKVIILLRDPVLRAHSHWMERSRNDVETLSFPDAIAAEHERTDGEEQRLIDDPSYTSFGHQHFSYVDQGRYARGLTRWYEAFPSNQILTLRSEDMYAAPSDIYGKVLDFLELDDYEPASFKSWNTKPKAAFDAGLEAELRDRLTPDIAEVEALLGRSMNWS